jgi:type I restriction-modification system DNA methylase subunit
MPDSRYLAADPYELEKIVTDALQGAFGRRGAKVIHRGGAGQPDIVVDAGDFCIVVELAKRSGADAASELPAILEHREKTEEEFGKPAYLLFSCIRTPERMVRQMARENLRLTHAGDRARMLFLELERLEAVLGRLGDSSFDLYPNERWKDWFAAWREIGDDAVAYERLSATVMVEDHEFRGRVEAEVTVRAQAEQERLRKDVRKLEDVLRQSSITGQDAMRSLIYLMFVKQYEENRELAGLPNRFTASGFADYRKGLPERARQETHAGRTLHHLLEQEIRADRRISASGMLDAAVLSSRLTDGMVEKKILPVLDRYRFGGTRLDALGAVFEAVARRAEKDTRIGQFFTPEAIVRFAVDVVRPEPDEVVLDPAAGTGRFLTISMERMLERAGEVPGAARDHVAKAIRRDLLLGADTDDWVATIARMNMFIHGGEARIRVENGLFLAERSGAGEAPLLDAVDVCLTNPPLGAMNYRHCADDLLQRYPGAYSDASEWLRKRLPLLPGEYQEERQIREAGARIERWCAAARKAAVSGDTRAENAARKHLARAEEAKSQARERLAAGLGRYRAQGESAKGGALFLAAIRDYLKPVRDPAAPPEWRGGKLGIIVDEAILNTPEYAETRRFIRRHYFVKAVFSFHRDAFWYQARTTAKTSLLYLVRKEDDAVRQREPVFYAHVNQIGFTRTGKNAPSDLPNTLQTYREFESAVLGCYRGSWFDERAARSLGFAPEALMQWPGEVDDGARMDYAAEAARQLRAGLPADLPVLGDFVTLEVRNPPEDPSGIYTFATIDRTTGEVRQARTESTEYAPADLRVIREGDIVVSGIDLVNGAVGYAYREVSGRVVSKEFYTLALKPECAGSVDARFLALMLQTPHAREMVAGRVTGTSNRTRIEDASALLGLPLPPLPSPEVQRAMVDEVERALRARRSARAALARAQASANGHWAAQYTPPEARGHDEPEMMASA